MNELLAIIIIVFLCCAMFFAWLISMATCPDRMVDLISGSPNQQGSSSSSTPTTSKELISGSNSPNTKRSAADPATTSGSVPSGKPKKKYSAAFLQLGAPFKQRVAAGGPADAPTGRPNPKKLSVVPEQDEVTVYSKTSQTHQQYANSSVREPLIESVNELSSNDLPLMPYTVPIAIDMPVERCVEDVIDARRRQRQQQIHQQQQMEPQIQDPYSNNIVGFASEELVDAAEDTIFLLPTCYDLLHAALAELDSDDERRAADAISLPNSPLASPAAVVGRPTASAALPYHHNEYCHSETLIVWPPNVVEQPVQSLPWPIARRLSLPYIV